MTRERRQRQEQLKDDVILANSDLTVFSDLWLTCCHPDAGLQMRGLKKLKFSLAVTFYLTETENRTKKSLTQLLHYCFE